MSTAGDTITLPQHEYDTLHFASLLHKGVGKDAYVDPNTDVPCCIHGQADAAGVDRQVLYRAGLSIWQNDRIVDEVLAAKRSKAKRISWEEFTTHGRIRRAT